MKRIAIAMVAILLPISMNLIYTSSSTDNKTKVQEKINVEKEKNALTRQNISIKLIY